VLRVAERAIGPPGPGEALVDVAAIGLNRAEFIFRSGNYIMPTRLPAGLGNEAAGTVVAVGEGVTRWSAGDPVSIVAAFSMNGHTVYDEHAVVPGGPPRPGRLRRRRRNPALLGRSCGRSESHSQ